MSDVERVPSGYKHIHCQIIFDVRMWDFRHKAILVADEDMSETHKCHTYSIVASNDNVRLKLTMYALNELQVKSSDVMNAYITATITKNVWTVFGNELGADSGKKSTTVCSLCVLNSYGAAFCKHLSDFIRHVGYNPCPSNPEKWINPEFDTDVYIYYSYILCYIDVILVVHHYAMTMIKHINKYF